MGEAQDRLNDAGFAIKKQFAKSADALSDIARGAEAGAGGTLVRKGSNYSAHVNDAHKASKAKMQDSIQRVEKEIEAGKSVSKVRQTLNIKKITMSNTRQDPLKSLLNVMVLVVDIIMMSLRIILIVILTSMSWKLLLRKNIQV